LENHLEFATNPALEFGIDGLASLSQKLPVAVKRL
jgi:hypothetical protein